MSDPLDFAIDNARFALKVAEAYLKSHKADYAEIKTEGYYNRVLNHNVLLLYNGEMSESEFVDDLARLIEQQFTRAWREGARDVGFDPDQMTEAQQGALEERILQEYDFVDNYAAEIVQAAKDGEDVKPFQDRTDLWSNRYNEVREEAKIEFSKGTGQMFEWIFGDTEHCSTCAALNGIVATADDWEASGYHPQGAPNEMLECGGWQCQCSLEPTDKPKTEGGIPNV